MAVKRYTASKDNTVTNSYKFNLTSRAYSSNMGSSDIMEIYSIFGQANSSSLEKTRILVDFPIEEIHKDRLASTIPRSGSVKFYMVLTNAEHGQSTPEKYTISAIPILREWDEGYGLDMESFLDEGASNWLSASDGNLWHTQGGDYRDYHINPYTAVPNEYTQYLKSGIENIEMDVTHIVEEWISGQANDMPSATSKIVFTNDISRFSGSTLTLYSHEGQQGIFKFTRGNGGTTVSAGEPTGSSGNTHYVPTGSNVSELITNLYDSVVSAFSSKIYGQVETGNRSMELTQSSGGFFGNTVITASVHQTSSITISAGNIADGDRFEIRFAGLNLTSKFYSFTASGDAGTYNFDKGASNVAAATNLYTKIKSTAEVANYMEPSNPSNGVVVLKMFKPGPVYGSGSVSFRLRSGGTIPASRVEINGISNEVDSNINQINFNPPSIYQSLPPVFTGGESAPSNGLLLKLSGSYEAGSLKRSFYTKKFFARGSQYFFHRPRLEARWDSSMKDDRGSVYKSSSLAEEADNLNSIFLYNRQRGGLTDLPNTSSYLLAQLVTSSTGGTPETLSKGGGVSPGALTYITASRMDKGVYRAQFAYPGNSATLYDMWYRGEKKTKATATLSVTESPTAGNTITIIDNSETPVSKTYIAHQDGSLSDLHFDVDGSQQTVALAIKAAIESSGGHNGTILVSDPVNTTGNTWAITLTQNVEGPTGNTTITSNVTNLDAGSGVAKNGEFSGGAVPITALGITGSPFTIRKMEHDFYHHTPSYLTKIINLKPSYNSNERVTFRVFTRDKNWAPNVYSKATNKVPISNIRDGYYKLKRVADDLTVIPYSTGSVPSYSSMSYDLSGSYFDLDMSLLESGYLYEISFLYRFGGDYVEQKEKFKFRVEA